MPVSLEISDASQSAIEIVKELGGNLSMQYRTPLLMRYHLKPWAFRQDKELKTPMPPAKKLKKLEKIRKKGIEVEYPRTPWFTDNVEALNKEEADRKKRLSEAKHAHLLEQLPAERVHRSGKPKVEREELPWNFKYPS